MNTTPIQSSTDADVLVVGAGPAGLALACGLADAGLRVLLLEQQARASLDEPAEDGREIALTHRARRVMQVLGLWDRLPASAIAPLREARVLNGDSSAPLCIDAGSHAEPLGWLVPNHHIRAAALAAALARPQVRLVCDARVVALAHAIAAAQVTLADGRVFRAPLVVAADSRFSSTRRLAGIGASLHDFARSAVLGRVAHAGRNDAIAWECFRHGNTLALLPLNEQLASAVVTVPSDQVPQWMALDDNVFAARVQQQAPASLGAMKAAGPRHVYPLVGVYAHRFTAPRVALIGDAAVGMHPVTAHGWNFGLYGVEVLVRELQAAHRAGRDIGSLAVLEPFEAEHRRTTLPIYLGTNALVSLFTAERGWTRLVRRGVLAVAGHAPVLSDLIKAGITRQLTGVSPARLMRAWGR